MKESEDQTPRLSLALSLKKERQEGGQVVLEARGLSDGFIAYERM